VTPRCGRTLAERHDAEVIQERLLASIAARIGAAVGLPFTRPLLPMAAGTALVTVVAALASSMPRGVRRGSIRCAQLEPNSAA
jgi:hypothetical protein